jgi:hypothetical protein
MFITMFSFPNAPRACIALFLVMMTSAAYSQSGVDLPSGQPTEISRYVETTAGVSTELVAREWRIPGGLLLQSTDDAGNQHIVRVDTELETRFWQYSTGPDSAGSEATRVAVTRQGSDVTIRGTVAAEVVDQSVALPEPVWVQSIERSLRDFVVNGAPGDRLRFSVVQPDTLSARTLEARLMGDEQITVLDRQMSTRRVRISLPGIGVLIWRSNYWFRVTDGLFVQSRVTRGPPGTPETVVSLLSEGE